MNFIKRLFEFYINASIHIALAVYSCIRITEIYFDIPYNEPVNYFIFFGTITGYNFVKYARKAKLHHRKLTKNLKIIQLFSLFSFIIMCYYATQITLKIFFFSAPFCLLTILYAIPFLKRFSRNLRSIRYLKTIIVAFVWAGTTVIIPLISVENNINTAFVLVAIQRFLIVFVLILPFDIRDSKYDAISMQTLPQIVGVERAKKIGFIILMFALLLEFIISPSLLVSKAFLGFFLLMLIFLMRSKENQSRYYSPFWVESLPIIWWLLLLGFHNI